MPELSLSDIRGQKEMVLEMTRCVGFGLGRLRRTYWTYGPKELRTQAGSLRLLADELDVMAGMIEPADGN